MGPQPVKEPPLPRPAWSDSRASQAELRGPVESSDPDKYEGRRHYEVSRLPVMHSAADPDATPQVPAPNVVSSAREQVLLAVYNQSCAGWQMLTDVRFKLLALIPPVAGLALVGVVATSGPTAGLQPSARIGLAVFGLLITAGLYIYDQRNDTLYDDLISRSRRAEYELGVHTGVFLGRVDADKEFPRRMVRHGVATRLVYWTVLAAWVAAIAYVVFEL